MDATTSGQAQEKVQEAAGQAQEKAQEAAVQAKDRAREQLDQRSTQAGEQISTTASDMRSVAEQLRSQGKDQPAKLAEQAADRADRVGGYLKDADPDRLLHDLEDFGRRQPLAVVFGGIALGFAASRFLKASSQNRSQGVGSSSTNGSQSPLAELPRPAPATPPTAHPAPSQTPVGAPVPPAQSPPPTPATTPVPGMPR